MTKKEILETITQQEQAAWATYKKQLYKAIYADTHVYIAGADLPMPVAKAKEKWATLYCLLEKVQQ
ncbi:MAG: hypothetical protein NTW70_05895 [Chloroflexi bacterium]|nr:hypothetical protein [Chloroflexota bacterium]